MNKVEMLYQCKNTLGEGITYSSSNNNLYWLDINNISKLFKLNLSSNKKEIFELPEILFLDKAYTAIYLILAQNCTILFKAILYPSIPNPAITAVAFWETYDWCLKDSLL